LPGTNTSLLSLLKQLAVEESLATLSTAAVASPTATPLSESKGVNNRSYSGLYSIEKGAKNGRRLAANSKVNKAVAVKGKGHKVSPISIILSVYYDVGLLLFRVC
jgi:hypothetical protein